MAIKRLIRFGFEVILPALDSAVTSFVLLHSAELLLLFVHVYSTA